MEKMIVVVIAVIKNIAHKRYDTYLIYHNQHHHITYKECQLHHNTLFVTAKSPTGSPVSSSSGLIWQLQVQ